MLTGLAAVLLWADQPIPYGERRLIWAAKPKLRRPGGLAFHRGERFTQFESLDSLREWAAFYIAYEHSYQEGCSLGSLASEIIKTDLDVRTELADAFVQWRDIFRDGLERMQRLGRISAAADPTRLAYLLLPGYQRLITETVPEPFWARPCDRWFMFQI